MSRTTAPIKIQYPASLFQCLPSPDASQVQTDNDLGVLIIQQDSVIQDCRSRLKTVGELVNGVNK